MNKKKLLLISCFLTTILLAGCGANAIDPTENTSQSTESTSSVESTTIIEENIIVETEIKPTDEILNLTLKEPAFQVGNSIFYLGESTIQDFIEAGGELVFNDNVKSLDFMQDGKSTEYITLSYNEVPFKVHVKNNTDELAPIKNSIIEDISEIRYKEIIGVGGLMVGDSYETVSDKFIKISEKSDSETITYYYANSEIDRIALTVEFDRNTMTVKEYTLKSEPIFITDFNQLNNESWEIVKQLYNGEFNSENIYNIGKLSSLITLNGSYNNPEDLTNIKPIKAILATVKEIKEDGDNPPRNFLIIEFTGDTKCVTDYWYGTTTEFNNMYSYCYIENVSIDKYGNIKLYDYTKMENGYSAYELEEHIKQNYLFEKEYGYTYEDYIFTEKELNWN